MNFFKKLFGSSKPKPKSNPKPVQQEREQRDVEAEFKRALDILSQHKRTAYLPTVQEGPKTFSTQSKIGGFPYLRHEDDWPVCPNCKKNMQLFLQLNLKQLPVNQEEGIVQLFYCTNEAPLCEDDLEAYFPFSEATCCRKIKIEDTSAQIQPTMDDVFIEKVITDWTAVDDYPHYEEYSELGIDIELEDDLYHMMEEKKLGFPLEGEKLFGWPYWVQNVEYPFDRKTRSRMELLFQLDSEKHLPWMFGDSGIGHLTQSPDNKEELGFGWACC